ncbi:MAG: hydantoinase B/oxoprolinase family protein, partial [Rhodospirillales bacterium]|nr:hydantoinase B/oxoprolinase family protein [Rhodospirillales bacterium]
AAARGHIVEKGRDPRRYAVVGMGGAGPAHVGRVARILGVDEVIIPPASGAASALGFLIAPISFERLRSQPELLDELDFGSVNGLLDELEAEGRELIAEAGVAPADVIVTRTADMRLFGQMHEITVPLPNEALDENSLAEIKTAFADEYTRRYTHLYEGAQIQALHWRVLCSGPVPALDATRDAGHTGGGTEQKGTRKAYFPEAGGFTETPVYDRYALATGKHIEGPAIIEEWEASTVVSPGDTVTVDEHGNLRLTIERHTRLETMVPAGMPLAEAVARIENDPIGLEIMWRRLINVAEESWDTVIRTAFSLIIGEAQDFACEVLDATGKQLAHSNRAMPSFSITLPMAVNGMIEKIPVETLKPGDVLITNDPWLCAGHLNDIAIATPVFRKGRVVALVGSVGHVTDIGGTKDNLNARELYDEGFQIPPMKMFREGEINETLMTLLAENVRGSEQVLGDLHALVSANASGAERIIEFMDEYGMEDLEALTTVVQSRAEKAMRDAVRELPDGVYESEIWGSGVGPPERFPIKVTIQGDEIEVDYEGTPPERETGASNSTLSFTVAYTCYTLKCILTPDVPSNAGCYRMFTIKAPEGCRLNTRKPSAVYLRTRTTWYCPANILYAMAGPAPDKVQAFTGFPSSHLFYGRDSDGTVYDDHLFQGGGQGASSRQDGKSGLLWPTTAADTSIELAETRAPILVLNRQYVPDTGGAGRYRGGLGQVIQCRKLYDDGMPADARLYPIGVGIDSPGLFKGQPGGPTWARVLDSKGAELSNLGIGGMFSLRTTEHIADLQLAGGSGYGDPLDRPYEEVQRDLDGEYVTPQGAERDYACVAGADGKIDAAASDALRKQRRKVLVPAQ